MGFWPLSFPTTSLLKLLGIDIVFFQQQFRSESIGCCVENLKDVALFILIFIQTWCAILEGLFFL